MVGGENMTDYKMNEEYQKLLTEMLGECWHEIIVPAPEGKFGLGYCPKCEQSFSAIHTSDWNPEAFNRSFTTSDDKDKVFRWLVDEEKWDVFCFYVTRIYYGNDHDIVYNFYAWLFYDSERFCCLAAMALEENVI
jgi:hypothetical protein